MNGNNAILGYRKELHDFSGSDNMLIGPSAGKSIGCRTRDEYTGANAGKDMTGNEWRVPHDHIAGCNSDLTISKPTDDAPIFELMKSSGEERLRVTETDEHYIIWLKK